jgi:hypothetical protein
MATQVTEKPRGSDAARDEIERTRARMSGTIDEIEVALQRKKAELRDRLDVSARLREKPLAVVGVALGVGLLFGLISGGGKANRRRAEEAEAEREFRAARWERRARKLLSIAQAQESRIRQLESAVDELGELYSGARYDDDGLDGLPSRFAEFRESVAERIEEAAAATAARFRETMGRRA